MIKDIITNSIKKAFDIDLNEHKEIKLSICNSSSIKYDRGKYLYIYIVNQLKEHLLQNLSLEEISTKIKENIEDIQNFISNIIVCTIEGEYIIKIEPSNNYYYDKELEIYNTYNNYNNKNDKEESKKIYISLKEIDDITVPIDYITYRSIIYTIGLHKKLLLSNNIVYSSIIVDDLYNDKLTSFIEDIVNLYNEKAYKDKLYIKNDFDISLFKQNIFESLYDNNYRNSSEMITIKDNKEIIINAILNSINKIPFINDNMYTKIERMSCLLKTDIPNKFLKYMKDKELLISNNNILYFNSSKYGDNKDRVLISKDGSYTKLFYKYVYLFYLFLLNKYDKTLFIKSKKDSWEFDLINIFLKAIDVKRDIEFKIVGDIYDKDKNVISNNPLNNLYDKYGDIGDTKNFINEDITYEKLKYNILDTKLSNNLYLYDNEKYKCYKNLKQVLVNIKKLSYNYCNGYYILNDNREVFNDIYFKNIINNLLLLTKYKNNSFESYIIIDKISKVIKELKKCLRDANITDESLDIKNIKGKVKVLIMASKFIQNLLSIRLDLYV